MGVKIKKFSVVKRPSASGVTPPRFFHFFSNFSYIQVTQKHKSKMKIQVAIARKILVAVWHMLSKEEDFIDIYLKRLEEQRLMEEKLKSLEAKMA